MSTLTLFGDSHSKKISEKQAINRISLWVKMSLGVDKMDELKRKDIHIMVTEIQCNIPDCAPIETLVIVINSKGKWTDKILKPLLEVTEGDISNLQISLNCEESEPLEKEESLRAFHKVLDDSPIIDTAVDTPDELNWLIQLTGSIQTGINTLNVNDRLKAMAYLDNFLSDLKVSFNCPTTRNIQNKPIEANIQQPTITVVPMKPKDNIIAKLNENIAKELQGDKLESGPPIRHKKGGVRQRGCPCCDPENLDNIIDSLMMKLPP